MHRILGALIAAAGLLPAASHAGETPVSCVGSAAALPVQDYAAFDARHRSRGAKEFDFAKLSRCLHSTDTDEVPALLIRLADASAAATLKLTSVSSDDATLPARVQVLDAQFSVLKDYRFDVFAKRSSNYSATLFLDAALKPQYLLITPDLAWVGRENRTTTGTRWTTIFATARLAGAYSDGYESKRAIPFASGGLVRIETEEDGRFLDGATRR